MRLCRYEGWVVVRTLQVNERSLYSVRGLLLRTSHAAWSVCRFVGGRARRAGLHSADDGSPLSQLRRGGGPSGPRARVDGTPRRRVPPHGRRLGRTVGGVRVSALPRAHHAVRSQWILDRIACVMRLFTARRTCSVVCVSVCLHC